MNEKKIEELFQTAEINETEDLDRKIQKGIRNNIYRRAAITVLTALVLIAAAMYGADRIKEKTSFHLSDWKCVVSDELVERTKETYGIENSDAVREILNAQAYISAYSSIFLPGIVPEFFLLECILSCFLDSGFLPYFSLLFFSALTSNRPKLNAFSTNFVS